MPFYNFWGKGLPENGNQKNTFLQVETTGVFCYNDTEIWQLIDKGTDKWNPGNGVASQTAGLPYHENIVENGSEHDTNPASTSDFAVAIAELEKYIDKENITGFSFHVPWYWNTFDDSFLPLNSTLPTIYNGNPILQLYRKEKNEGLIHERSGGSPTLTNRFFTVPGNHDAGESLHSLADYQESFRRYLEYFDFLPNNPHGTQPNHRYYSFVKGCVEFFMCNWCAPQQIVEPDGTGLFTNVIFNGDEVDFYYSGPYSSDSSATFAVIDIGAPHNKVAKFMWRSSSSWAGCYMGVRPELLSTGTPSLDFKFNSDITAYLPNSDIGGLYSYKSYIKAASINGDWLVFVTHRTSAPDVAHFNDLIDYANSLGVTIGTVNQCLDIIALGGTPRGLVSFVFDDAHIDHYTIMYPAFAAKGAMASCLVNTSFIDGANNMTWANLLTLQTAGWEIMNHGKTHDDLTTMTETQIRDQVNGAKTIFTANGITINNYGYPSGFSNALVRSVVAEQHRSGRAASGGLQSWGMPDIYNINATVMGLYQAPYGTGGGNINVYKGYVDSAYATNKWLIFITHRTYPEDVTNYNQLIDYIHSLGMTIGTINQCLDIIAGGGSPRGLVTFVFDDGYEDVYTLMLPTFTAKGAVACSLDAITFIGAPGKMTWTQLTALQTAGWEILNHSMNHIDPMTNLSEAALRVEINDARAVFISHGITINNFGYPGGNTNAAVKAIVAEQHRSARGVQGDLNNWPPVDQFNLNGFSIDTVVTVNWTSPTYLDYNITIKNNTDSWSYLLSQTVPSIPGFNDVSIPWSSFAPVSPTIGPVVHPITSLDIDVPTGIGNFEIDDISFGAITMSVQAQWLKDALAASTAAWKVVVGHNPPYSSGEVGPTKAARWRFKDWGADIVIGGDEHSYERLVVDGFPYIVQGAGGAPLNSFWRTIDPGSQFRYLDQHDALGVLQTLPFQNAIGYGAHKVTATETVLNFKFYNRIGALIDDYTLAKAGTPVTSMMFALIGDYGVDWGSNRDVSNMVKSWNPDFVVSAGDNYYQNWLYADEAATIPADGDRAIGKFYNVFIYPYKGRFTSGKVNGAGALLSENPYSVTIGGMPIGNAALMPNWGGGPAYGGTPDDAGLLEGIRMVINKGYKFIFYSFMEVVDPPNVTKPWRGNLLPGGGGWSGVNPSYVSTPTELLAFMDRIKVQHIFYANYCVTNNIKPYAFVLTSEMTLLNQHKTYSTDTNYATLNAEIHTDSYGTFKFTSISKWKEMYDEVKAIFVAKGWPDVLVGYSPDWGEYHGFNNNGAYPGTVNDGSYFRQLDELYVHQDIVFMDAYFPITDSRSNDLSYSAFKAGWTNGRDYDYAITSYNLWKYYNGGTAPITLPEFAPKNLKWWINNYHDHVGPPPTYTRTRTPWVPNSKKIFFNEVGCSPISSGASEPNLVFSAGIQGGIPRGAIWEITITNVDMLCTAVMVPTIDNPSGLHGFLSGDEIAVAGAEVVGYNGRHIITKIISPTVFQFRITRYTPSQANDVLPWYQTRRYTMVLRVSTIVAYNYFKSLHENIIDGTLPLVGVNIWQCDSRPLSVLAGPKGEIYWYLDWFRLHFSPWLDYYFPLPEGELSFKAAAKIVKLVKSNGVSLIRSIMT